MQHVFNFISVYDFGGCFPGISPQIWLKKREFPPAEYKFPVGKHSPILISEKWTDLGKRRITGELSI